MSEQKQLFAVDFSEVKYYSQMHLAIKDGLCFPDYYGNNWDAFWDCVTDMYGDEIYIVFKGLDKLKHSLGDSIETDISILKTLLYRFKHNYNDLFCNEITVEIQDGNIISFIE